MPGMRDFLQRFRPAGASGAAAAAVPADRRVALAAELEPVFALFTDVEDERRRLLDQADQEARSIRATGRAQATALIARARAQADAERAAAATDVREATAAHDADLLDTARQEAAVVRRTAAARLPALVAEAVETVRALAGEDDGGGPADRGTGRGARPETGRGPGGRGAGQ
ncbi:MAG TPA: hypothetical protein VFU43_28855 [Streptosporangiaceae bacterium]|nr:hypothetical protein [Streptosporangiaceae bacterium]